MINIITCCGLDIIKVDKTHDFHISHHHNSVTSLKAAVVVQSKLNKLLLRFNITMNYTLCVHVQVL